MNNIIDACNHLFINWKKNQKNKKKVTNDEIKKLIENKSLKEEKIPNTKIKIITGNVSSLDVYAVSGQITKGDNYISHISDGNKITSAASSNIDIDLTKEIAPKIGKVLGGSGGGKPKLTQSGGPKKEKIKEALNLAKELTKKSIN